jgi:tyrosyl-tRNA synthetase
LNAADADAIKWIKIFTLLPKEEIEQLIEEHSKAPESRIVQKKLAECITSFVHGKEECATAIQTTEQLFGKKDDLDLTSLSEKELLDAMGGVPVQAIEHAKIGAGIDVVSFLVDTGIFPSKGEARKMIQGGGISVNKEKVTDPNLAINEAHLLAGNHIVVQKGKKNHFLVKTN